MVPTRVKPIRLGRYERRFAKLAQRFAAIAIFLHIASEMEAASNLLLKLRTLSG